MADADSPLQQLVEPRSKAGVAAVDRVLRIAQQKGQAQLALLAMSGLGRVTVGHPDPPFYGQVFRDGARLKLRCLPQPPIDPQLRDSEHLLSASITVDDAKPLFLEYQAAGVRFHQTLRTGPWGARTFNVRDPDGT